MQSLARFVTLCTLCLHVAAQAQPAVDDVPRFSVRARVTSTGDGKPEGRTFSFQWSGIPSERAESTADGWSSQLAFGASQAEATLAGYPAIYMKRYPIVVRLQVTPVKDPTILDVELEFADGGGGPGSGVVTLAGELFGPTLGILVWRDEDRRPRAETMATYNRRYWRHL